MWYCVTGWVVLTFWRIIMLPKALFLVHLTREKKRSMFVQIISTDRAVWHYIPEDRNPHFHPWKTLKTHKVGVFFGGWGGGVQPSVNLPVTTARQLIFILQSHTHILHNSCAHYFRFLLCLYIRIFESITLIILLSSFKIRSLTVESVQYRMFWLAKPSALECCAAK
jgi:hypothetical protein